MRAFKILSRYSENIDFRHRLVSTNSVTLVARAKGPSSTKASGSTTATATRKAITLVASLHCRRLRDTTIYLTHTRYHYFIYWTSYMTGSVCIDIFKKQVLGAFCLSMSKTHGKLRVQNRYFEHAICPTLYFPPLISVMLRADYLKKSRFLLKLQITFAALFYVLIIWPLNRAK